MEEGRRERGVVVVCVGGMHGEDIETDINRERRAIKGGWRGMEEDNEGRRSICCMHVQEFLYHSVRRKCGVVYICFDLFVVVSLYAHFMHLNFSLCIYLCTILRKLHTHMYMYTRVLG